MYKILYPVIVRVVYNVFISGDGQSKKYSFSVTVTIGSHKSRSIFLPLIARKLILTSKLLGVKGVLLKRPLPVV